MPVGAVADSRIVSRAWRKIIARGAQKVLLITTRNVLIRGNVNIGAPFSRVDPIGQLYDDRMSKAPFLKIVLGVGLLIPGADPG